MSVFKGTPGPWRVSDVSDGGYGIEAAGGEWGTMILCSREPWRNRSEMSIANAHLIAAAPDLLAALQEAIACDMVPTSSASEGGASAYVRQVRCADMIRAAIAKALGEDQ